MAQGFNAIAFQGFAGAYSDMACRAVFPGLPTLPCPSFEEAFAAVEEGRADLAMIPVDNNLAGRVADVHHLLPASGLYIIAEHFQPIGHALLGVKGAKLEDLRHVHSHVHALPQCRKAIRRLKLTPHVHADTAGAAEEVARRGDPAHAAIASALAGEIYGLEVLEGNVQDAGYNTMRFIVLSRQEKVPEFTPGAPMLTSFVFRVRNIPAALYKSLGGFASNGVNLAKIESYVDERFQAAQFYCEAEAHPAEERLRLALEELAFFARDCRLLGTYAAHPFRRQQDL
jgi:prephenate dehydratase